MTDCDVLEADVTAEEVADECTSSDQFSDDSVQIISKTPGPTSLTRFSLLLKDHQVLRKANNYMGGVRQLIPLSYYSDEQSDSDEDFEVVALPLCSTKSHKR